MVLHRVREERGHPWSVRAMGAGTATVRLQVGCPADPPADLCSALSEHPVCAEPANRASGCDAQGSPLRHRR